LGLAGLGGVGLWLLSSDKAGNIFGGLILPMDIGTVGGTIFSILAIWPDKVALFLNYIRCCSVKKASELETLLQNLKELQEEQTDVEKGETAVAHKESGFGRGRQEHL
jgi:hypothetical protein